MKKILFLTAFIISVFAFGMTAAAQTKIGMKKAREIAMQKASGKIESEELEKENGKTVYSFDIRNAKGTITEVQVEAYTGEIVSVEEENAQKEAIEKRQEKNEKMEKKDDYDDEESEASKKANQEKYAKQAKITMQQAKEIALKKVPGTIVEEDLEMEKGRLQYAFDVKDANGKVFDVEIDAKTGKVLKAVEDSENEDDDN